MGRDRSEAGMTNLAITLSLAGLLLVLLIVAVAVSITLQKNDTTTTITSSPGASAVPASSGQSTTTTASVSGTGAAAEVAACRSDVSDLGEVMRVRKGSRRRTIRPVHHGLQHRVEWPGRVRWETRHVYERPYQR